MNHYDHWSTCSQCVSTEQSLYPAPVLATYERATPGEFLADWRVTCPKCGISVIRELCTIPKGLVDEIKRRTEWAKVSEADFMKQVMRLATMYDWLHHHTPTVKVDDNWVTPTRGHAGFPDLVLVAGFRPPIDPGQRTPRPRPARKGGVLFVELKTDSGTLRPMQEQWAKRLTEQGAEYHVWRPRDMARIVARLSGYPELDTGEPF